MKVELTINGNRTIVDTDPERRLVDVLRQDLGFARTKAACYAGSCGTCTIIMEGVTVYSCLIPLFAAGHKSITTIEGIEKTRSYREIVRAFKAAGYEPCRHCYQGKVLSLYELLERASAPVDADVEEIIQANRCRCSDYSALLEAVRIIIEERRRRQHGAFL